MPRHGQVEQENQCKSSICVTGCLVLRSLNTDDLKQFHFSISYVIHHSGIGMGPKIQEKFTPRSADAPIKIIRFQK